MLDPAVFQRRFALAVMGRRTPGPFRAPGFAVYRNTWVKSLLEALAANYPVIAALLGADVFKSVAIEYVRTQRSASPVLALYGHSFPAHLAGLPLLDELPYIADVARLERLWTECLFAAESEPLNPAVFHQLMPKQAATLRPRLHPAARLARFESPAVTIWAAHQQGEFKEFEPEWQIEHALVHRKGASVSVRLLPEPEFQLLWELQQGRSIGAAIRTVAAANGSAQLPPMITNIISSGALTLSVQTQRND
ncbi:DNA-binding domain-containing protein [Sphingomonas sp.]|uniref:HvfC/BufC N-terminal domain-containing protein n=1 Tax=Sphingomonas sp. TaxID=28214 RepID=UPI0017C7B9CE|nr:DNA-binding domain-containing protein [Sphingomonas sp.]MBA3511131.1 putative DNA-binding domain-containing protein [Sphingomonas sp.]